MTTIKRKHSGHTIRVTVVAAADELAARSQPVGLSKRDCTVRRNARPVDSREPTYEQAREGMMRGELWWQLHNGEWFLSRIRNCVAECCATNGHWGRDHNQEDATRWRRCQHPWTVIL